MRTVAAPVLEQTGRAIPAVSATVSADRCELEPFITVAVPKVVAAAGQLTEAVRLTFGEIIREDLRK